MESDGHRVVVVHHRGERLEGVGETRERVGHVLCDCGGTIDELDLSARGGERCLTSIRVNAELTLGEARAVDRQARPGVVDGLVDGL